MRTKITKSKRLTALFLAVVMLLPFGTGIAFNAQALGTSDSSIAAQHSSDAFVPATFALQWTSAPDGVYLAYDENGVCQLTPAQNASSTTTAGTSTQCTITFSLGGDTSALPGQVEIRLPKYMFESRDGNPQGITKLGISDKQEGTTGFYYYIDEDTQEIVITNYQTILPADVFKCDVVYYSTNGDDQLPSQIKSSYSKEFHADATITLGDSEPVTASTDSIALQYNTRATLGTFNKYFNSKFEKWQADWGEKPDDAGGYFYARWSISYYSIKGNTQPHTVSFTDTPDANGTVVGISSLYNLKDCAGITSIPDYRIDMPSESSQQYYGFYVLTRHPRSAIAAGTTTFKNDITATLTGDDGESNSKTASASYTYVDSAFKYPNDSYAVYKSNTLSTSATGMINKLEAAGANDAVSVGIWTANVESRGWSLTREPGADPKVYESYGKRPYTIELTDDFMTLNNTRLTDEDYAFTSCWFNLREINYVMDENTGNWTEPMDLNYETWKPITVEYQIGTNGTWQTIGNIAAETDAAYPNQPVYLFTDTSGTTRPLDQQNPLLFPAGTTGVRATYMTTFYRTYLHIMLNTELHGTEHVHSLLAGQDSATCYNVDTLRVLDQDGKWVNKQTKNTITGTLANIVKDRDTALYGANVYGQHWSANKDMARLRTSTQATKTATYTNDTAKGRLKANYRADLYEELLYSNNDRNMMEDEQAFLDMGIMKTQSHGAIYDLLPAGMHADAASIKVWSYQNGGYYETDYSYFYYDQFRCANTVEFVENWRDSGRTMMILRVEAPTDRNNLTYGYSKNSNDYYNSNSVSSGFHLEYDAYYAWEDAIEYGNSPRNSIAYQSGVGKMGDAYPDDGGTITDKALMADLDGDGNPAGTLRNTIYAETAASFNLPVSALLGFSKRVKTAADPAYTMETSTVGGGDYSYQLRLASQKNMTSENIILYDVLESYNLSNLNRWSGTLQGVDVSQSLEKGVDAVTYYSTKPGLVIANAADRDLTDSSKWSSTAPTDLSTVTALAFDLRTKKDGQPYVLQPEQSVSVVIHMKAPTGNVKALEAAKALAYNSAWFTGTTTSIPTNATNSNVLESKNTTVGIREPRLELHKETTPVTGTYANPADVRENDALAYDVHVTNKETAFPIETIKIEDTIPTGLTIDFDNIKWYIGHNAENAALVSGSSRVTVSREGQKLTFTVDRLLAGETAHFLIPTTVDENEKAMRYENTARITEVGGAEYGLESETTYHKKDVKKGNLTVSKTVSGAGAETGKEFTFTVTLDDTSISGMFGDMTFENGVASFALKHGESKSATGLPAGVGYIVTESNNAGYTVTVNQTSGTRASGTILAEETVIAAFNNDKPGSEPPDPYPYSAEVTLPAKKTLDGAAPGNNTFTFYLKDKDGNVLQAKQNNGDGAVAFNRLFFLQTGTYTYTLMEHAGDDSTIKYDAAVYTITIEVTVQGDTLMASVAYRKDGESFIGTPIFMNTTTNIPDDRTSVAVNKVWKGVDANPPTYISVQLYRNGAAYGDPVILNADNGWTHTWRDLNSAYQWTVDELNVPAGYEKTVTGINTRFTITNTKQVLPGPGDEGPHLTVNKVWKDGGSSKRPSEVWVQLYQNDSAYGDAVRLNADNGWTYTWSELDASYQWTVDEVNTPAGYIKTIYSSDEEVIIINERATDTVPKTGDEFAAGSLAALMALSLLAMGVAGILLSRDRRRKPEE